MFSISFFFFCYVCLLATFLGYSSNVTDSTLFVGSGSYSLFRSLGNCHVAPFVIKLCLLLVLLNAAAHELFSAELLEKMPFLSSSPTKISFKSMNLTYSDFIF
jgi:hypothetical protein